MAVSTAALDTTPVDLRTAASIEAVEARAWADLYAAAPADWARHAGLETEEVGGALVLRWATTGRRYFSRTIGLGVSEPAGRAAIEKILDGFERAGITMFLLQSLPHCRPMDYESRLGSRKPAPASGSSSSSASTDSIPAPGCHASSAVRAG